MAFDEGPMCGGKGIVYVDLLFKKLFKIYFLWICFSSSKADAWLRGNQIYFVEWMVKARSSRFGPSFFDYRIEPEATNSTYISVFPANCKVGMMGDVLLKMVRCRCCGRYFHVCRSCWRGQAYCGERCREIRQRRLHQIAQKKYRHTDKGRKTHRLYEQKRRKNQKKKKIMGDDSATPPKSCDMESKKRSGNRPRCLFCGSIGVVVDQFPRRAYGGKFFSEGSSFERAPYP